MKKEKQIELVQIKDVPYLNIDYSEFNGPIEEVSQRILGIRERLRKSHEQRETDWVKNNSPKFSIPDVTPFSDYKAIEVRLETDYSGYIEVRLLCYREKTKQELKADKERSERARLAGIESAKKRKESQEKREKALLETLKKKYEK
jgi:hypothetical protein